MMRDRKQVHLVWHVPVPNREQISWMISAFNFTIQEFAILVGVDYLIVEGWLDGTLIPAFTNCCIMWRIYCLPRVQSVIPKDMRVKKAPLPTIVKS